MKIWKEQENILDQEICRIKNEINDSEKECARFADTFIALSPSLTKLFQQVDIILYYYYYLVTKNDDFIHNKYFFEYN